MKEPKNKMIYQIILIAIILFGAIIRSTISGWLIFIGILSWIFLSFIHYRFHTIIASNYNKIYRKNRALLFLTHIVYLCLFLFQGDAGDDKGYVIIELLIGKFSFVDLHSIIWIVFSILLVFYSALIGTIVVRSDNTNPEINITSKIFKIIGYAILISAISISIFYASTYMEAAKNKNVSESNGEYDNLKSALKDKEKVMKLRLYEYPDAYIEIPKGVFELKYMKNLEMHYNQIKSIPTEISKLVSLEILQLQSNKIKEIPKEIGRLNALKELNLANNQITTISDSLCNCKALNKLDIAGPNLNKIPPCLKQIDKLQLSIQSDSINTIMRQLMDFNNLEVLNIKAYNHLNRNKELYQILKEKHQNTTFQ